MAQTNPRHERGLYCTAGQAILASEKRHCEGEQVRPCRVHIALHGCQQDVGDVGKLYVDDFGYNAWADTNRIIVLYPQTTAKAVNPQACWDWWSYVTHSDSYATKSGLQVKAIKAMLDALTAAARPAQTVAAAAGGAPERLVVADVSDTAADLAWTLVAGAKTYNVSRAGADGIFAREGSVSGPSFADFGLQPSTIYRWRVTAVATGVEGPSSPEAAAMTRSKPTPCNYPGACPISQVRN